MGPDERTTTAGASPSDAGGAADAGGGDALPAYRVGRERAISGTVGLALGGLAGSNAFGAGVLQAARDLGVRPLLISCTSGQLGWVDEYLRAGDGGPSLREPLRQMIKQAERTGIRDLDATLLGLLGVPGAVRPARWQYPRDAIRNYLQAWLAIATGWPKVSLVEQSLQIAPGRMLVPDFPDVFYKEMADRFNGSDVAIVFNSYHPGAGLEHVHLNPAALDLYERRTGRRDDYDPGRESRHRPQTLYQPITARAIRDGLWLYEYGFDKAPGFLDGAYFRQMMLSELWPATDIVAVRPLAHAWTGEELPTSFAAIQDLKNQVFFDGSYAGERGQITLINALLASGELSSASYHHIVLHEIELEERRGLLDYVFENEHVFDDGLAQGKRVLGAFQASAAR